MPIATDTDSPVLKWQRCTLLPDKTRIGWIGTGVMGASMCGHLLAAGFSATVHNRTRAKAEPLLAAAPAGPTTRGRWPKPPTWSSPWSAIRPRSARSCWASAARWPAAGRARVLVDMTTSEPSLAVEIAAAAAGTRRAVHRCARLRRRHRRPRGPACRSWSAATREAVEALEPCWQAMGKTIVHQGGPGAGQHTKMVNQVLIATNMIGVCEALLYAYKAGLDLETVMQSVASGAAGSWSLSNLGPRIIANNFAPGFFVEHFIKDMGIALEEARRMGLALPGLALAEQLYLSLAGDRPRPRRHAGVGARAGEDVGRGLGAERLGDGTGS